MRRRLAEYPTFKNEQARNRNPQTLRPAYRIHHCDHRDVLLKLIRPSLIGVVLRVIYVGRSPLDQNCARKVDESEGSSDCAQAESLPKQLATMDRCLRAG